MSDVFLVCDHCCCSTVLLGITPEWCTPSYNKTVPCECTPSYNEFQLFYFFFLVLVSLITTVIPQNAMSLFIYYRVLQNNTRLKVTNVNMHYVYCSTVLLF